MIWTLEIIGNVMELYKDHHILWDSQDPGYFDKAAREKAFDMIAHELNVPNVTGSDICRKLKTMRAAYQVEMRNINNSKLRGFYYRPTLKWFSLYKRIMEEIEDLKGWYTKSKSDDDISFEEDEGAPDTYVLKLRSQTSCPRKAKATHAQVVLPKPKKTKPTEEIRSTRPEVLVNRPRHVSPLKEDVYSDESDDEFQMFSDHIAEQLRTMSTHRAVLIQNQIQKIFAKEQEINGLP